MLEPQSNPIIRFGCYGWDDPRWQASYFPDDLPADWRLPYFANDAACVLVPVSQFSAMTPAQIGALAIDELRDEFRFYLDASDAGLPSAAIVDSLEKRLGAVICNQPLAAATGILVLTPRAVADGRAWACERHGLLRLDDIGPDLRDWRRRFDDLRIWMRDYDELAVIVRGERVTPVALNELKTLAELMGIA